MTDSNSSIQFYLEFDYEGKKYTYDVFRLDLNQSESGTQIYIQANPTEFELVQKAKYSSSDCFVFGIKNGHEINRMSIKHFDIKEKTYHTIESGLMYIQAVRSKLSFILLNALKEKNLGEYIISNLEQRCV